MFHKYMIFGNCAYDGSEKIILLAQLFITVFELFCDRNWGAKYVMPLSSFLKYLWCRYSEFYKTFIDLRKLSEICFDWTNNGASRVFDSNDGQKINIYFHRLNWNSNVVDSTLLLVPFKDLKEEITHFSSIGSAM